MVNFIYNYPKSFYATEEYYALNVRMGLEVEDSWKSSQLFFVVFFFWLLCLFSGILLLDTQTFPYLRESIVGGTTYIQTAEVASAVQGYMKYFGYLPIISRVVNSLLNILAFWISRETLQMEA